MAGDMMQNDEIATLQSAYGSEFHAIAYLSAFTGNFSFIPKVQRRLKLVVCHKGHTFNRKTTEEEITVNRLPPLYLYFTLPKKYPKEACPRFVLDCAWLPDKYLKGIARELIRIYNDTKDSILQKWAEHIKRKLETLFENDITLYEYRDETGAYKLSFEYDMWLEDRAKNNTLGRIMADSEDSDDGEGGVSMRRRKRKRRLVHNIYRAIANRRTRNEPEMSFTGLVYPVQELLASVFSEVRTLRHRLNVHRPHIPERGNRNVAACSACSSCSANVSNRAPAEPLDRNRLKRMEYASRVNIIFTSEARKKTAKQFLLMKYESVWDSVLSKDIDDSVVFHIEEYALEHKYLCGICLDKVLKEDCTVIYCGHSFCNECLTSYLTFKIKEKDVLKTFCPKLSCGFKFPSAIARGLLDFETYHKYKAVIAIELDERRSQLPSCIHYPLCKGVGKKMKVGEHYYKCKECSLQFCRKCRKEYHGETNCASEEEKRNKILELYENASEQEKEIMERKYTKATLDLWKQDFNSETFIQKNYKPCPKCYRRIEKYTGCDQMYCPKCKTHFCYKCLRARSTSEDEASDSDDELNDVSSFENPLKLPLATVEKVGYGPPTVSYPVMRQNSPFQTHTACSFDDSSNTNTSLDNNRCRPYDSDDSFYNIAVDINDGRLDVMRKNLARAKNARQKKIMEQLNRINICRNNFWKHYKDIFGTGKPENLTGRWENVPIRITSRE